jgi:hypothetical protein
MLADNPNGIATGYVALLDNDSPTSAARGMN